MKLMNGDTVADMNVLKGNGSSKSKKDTEYVLAVTSQGYGKRVPTTEFRTQKRGGQGVIAIKFKSNFEELSSRRPTARFFSLLPKASWFDNRWETFRVRDVLLPVSWFKKLMLKAVTVSAV